MKKHIVCYGDSNTYGYCALTDSRYGEEERYPRLLQDFLGPEYLIIEEGLPGRTTSFHDPIHEGLSGLDYLYPCLMSHAPVDLLILMLGTNDTKERFGASSACIALGLKRLIGKAVATADCWDGKGPDILIVAPKCIEKEYESTPVAATMGRGCAEKSQGLVPEFKKMAEQTGCRFFDANTVIEKNNTTDYMHLTEDGHRKLSAALSKLIRNR